MRGTIHLFPGGNAEYGPEQTAGEFPDRLRILSVGTALHPLACNPSRTKGHHIGRCNGRWRTSYLVNGHRQQHCRDIVALYRAKQSYHGLARHPSCQMVEKRRIFGPLPGCPQLLVLLSTSAKNCSRLCSYGSAAAVDLRWFFAKWNSFPLNRKPPTVFSLARPIQARSHNNALSEVSDHPLSGNSSYRRLLAFAVPAGNRRRALHSQKWKYGRVCV